MLKTDDRDPPRLACPGDERGRLAVDLSPFQTIPCLHPTDSMNPTSWQTLPLQYTRKQKESEPCPASEAEQHAV